MIQHEKIREGIIPIVVIFIVLAAVAAGGGAVYVGVKKAAERKTPQSRATQPSAAAESGPQTAPAQAVVEAGPKEFAPEQAPSVGQPDGFAKPKGEETGYMPKDKAVPSESAAKPATPKSVFSGIASPFASANPPEGNLPGLCGSADECFDYCTKNMKQCLSYCGGHGENALCAEMNKMLDQFGISVGMLSMMPDSMLAGMAEQMGGIFAGGDTTFDLGKEPLPALAVSNFIDLERIERVSKFRSGYGHDYSIGTGESCRSMKHYFWAYGGDPGSSHSPPWSTIALYAPANGKIWRMQKSGGEAQFAVRAGAHGAFSFIFHHVKLAPEIDEGVTVKAGQKLGTIASDRDHGEIAVEVLASGGRSLLSFFEVASPKVLALYKARGLASSKAVIISKAERDANPLQCDKNTAEGRFVGVSYDGLTDSSGLANWIELK